MKITKAVFIELTKDEVHTALIESLPVRFAGKWFTTRVHDDGSATLEQVEEPEK